MTHDIYVAKAVPTLRQESRRILDD
jgi:hypothetical protein